MDGTLLEPRRREPAGKGLRLPFTGRITRGAIGKPMAFLDPSLPSPVLGLFMADGAGEMRPCASGIWYLTVGRSVDDTLVASITKIARRR